MKSPSFREAGPLLRWSELGPGRISLELEAGFAELQVASDGGVRLRASASRELPPDPSQALGYDERTPANTRVVDQGNVGLSIEAPDSGIRIDVAGDPFRLAVRGEAGRRIAAWSGLAFAEDGRSRIAAGTEPNEHFYGLGEKSGGLDKRGRVLRIRNQETSMRTQSDPLYLGIPFYLSFLPGANGGTASGSFLLALGPSRFDLAAGDPHHVWMETDSGGIDLTAIPGPHPAQVLDRFTARVGRTPLPPRWSLGHHQSRWSYESEAEVRELAREIRKRHIPTDVIHLDIDYMDEYRVFTWNSENFPKPKRMMTDLAKQGFKIVTIIDPGVKVDPKDKTYREGRDKGYFCTRQDGSEYTLSVWPPVAAFPDFNRSEVRQWWAERHQSLLGAGVAGIWNDMNEPSGWQKDFRIGKLMLPYRWQDMSEVEQANPCDESRHVPHEEVRNIFALQECRATRTALETARPDQRHFVLTRSGFAGTQRYAAVWTGDNASRWADLRFSIPMLLNLSLSGVAFCGADIGGFAGWCRRELYARWIQIGALYPFARTHTWWMSRGQEPWKFGARVEKISREALELRMQLLPYLEAQFREAAARGTPIWRPLFFEFPDDARTLEMDDQLMFGPDLLVAPVMKRRARSREVYFPAGSWFAWQDDTRHDGPGVEKIDAPLERLPLFARAGSVIPTQSSIEHCSVAPEEPLVLQVFPGGDCQTEVVEDDGVSTDYIQGIVARTPLQLEASKPRQWKLSIDARVGSLKMPARRIRAVFHACPKVTAVRLNGRPLQERGGRPGFHREGDRLHVLLEDSGLCQVIEVERSA